jgi:hypothetical protein
LLQSNDFKLFIFNVLRWQEKTSPPLGFLTTLSHARQAQAARDDSQGGSRLFGRLAAHSDLVSVGFALEFGLVQLYLDGTNLKFLESILCARSGGGV